MKRIDHALNRGNANSTIFNNPADFSAFERRLISVSRLISNRCQASGCLAKAGGLGGLIDHASQSPRPRKPPRPVQVCRRIRINPEPGMSQKVLTRCVSKTAHNSPSAGLTLSRNLSSQHFLARLAEERRTIVATWRIHVLAMRLAVSERSPLPNSAHARRQILGMIDRKELRPLRECNGVYRVSQKFVRLE